MFDPALAVSSDRRTVVLHAARSWRLAIERGDATQPALHRALIRCGCDVLAPSFDSLLRLHEDCLGRPIGTSQAYSTTMTVDEALLLQCLEGSTAADDIISKFTARSALASTFKAALASTRLMISLAFQRNDFVGLTQQRWLARGTN